MTVDGLNAFDHSIPLRSDFSFCALSLPASWIQLRAYGRSFVEKAPSRGKGIANLNEPYVSFYGAQHG